LEKVNIRMLLVEVLQKAKWRWKFPGKSPIEYWSGCSSYWQGRRGIFVFVNTSAVPNTTKAAEVLSGELASVLHSQPGEGLVPIEAGPHYSPSDTTDLESPFTRVAMDPGTILVLVGTPPLADLTDASN
jgi:hypothetical protein